MLLFIPSAATLNPQFIAAPPRGEYCPISIPNDLEWQLVEAEENSLDEIMRRETSKIKVSQGMLVILRTQLQAATTLDDNEQAPEDTLSEHFLRILIKAEEANLADMQERQSHVKFHFEYHLDALHERFKEKHYLTAFHYLETVGQCARFKKKLEEFVKPNHQDWLVWAYQQELTAMNSADNGAMELKRLMIGEGEVASGEEIGGVNGMTDVGERDMAMDRQGPQSIQGSLM